MKAIREFHKVGSDKIIKISLPEHFNATEVEVIVLPSNNEYMLSDEIKNLVMERRNDYYTNTDENDDLDDILNDLEKDL